MKLISSITALPLVCTLSLSAVQADDWLFYRGPHLDGASHETAWKHDWDGDPKVAWRAKVGAGAASFVVKGRQVITTGNIDDKDIVWCFDLDSGKEIWKFDFPCEFEKRMFEGGTASTPTIDGDKVYNLSYDGQLHCLNLKDGTLVWKTHLVKDFGGNLSTWKYAGSPLVIGNLLILDNGGKSNSTLALNKANGEKVWGNGEWNAGYSTPIPIKLGGRDAVLVLKGTHLVAHDLKSGATLWEVPWKTSYDVNASSPIVLPNDRLLVTSGYKDGRAVMFDVSGKTPKQLWINEKVKTKMSSAVVHGDYGFAVSSDNDGKLMCFSLKDGKTAWEAPGFGAGDVILAGDRLIVLGEKGNMVVAKATGESYQPLTEAQILSARCWVAPVLANGRLLAKNNDGSTVCLDLR